MTPERDDQQRFAEALAAVLTMVDLRRWGQAAQIWLHLIHRQLAEPGGVPMSRRKLAELTGLDQRYAGRLLERMRLQGVVQLVELGVGRRPSRWRINPDVQRWVGVPLTIDPEIAMWRLWHIGLGNPTLIARLLGYTSSSPTRRIAEPFGVSLGPPLRGRSGVTHAPPLEAVEAVIEAIFGGVDVAITGGAVRHNGPPDVATTGGAVRHNGGGEAGVAPSSMGPADPLSGERESEVASDGQAVRSVIDLVAATSRSPVGGRLIDEAAALARAAPFDRLQELCAEAPSGLKSPMLLEWLRLQLAGDGIGAPAPGVGRKRRIQTLEALLATFQAEGAVEEAEQIQVELDSLLESP